MTFTSFPTSTCGLLDLSFEAEIKPCKTVKPFTTLLAINVSELSFPFAMDREHRAQAIMLRRAFTILEHKANLPSN